MNHPGAIIFAVIGIILLIGLIGNLIRKSKATKWPTAKGTILTSTVELRKSTGNSMLYYPLVEYSFEIAGLRYSGRDIDGTSTGISIEGMAKGVADKYPVGSEVTVYYKPEKPSDCLLDPKPKTMDYVFLLIPLGALGVAFHLANKG